jgi:hypothetical protein
VDYGYSDQRDCFDRSIKVQARILSRLLDFLGIESLFVAGHDIGGAVGQRFVVDHAAMVRKWALIDSVLYDSWPADPMVRLGNPKLHYRTHGDELAQKFIERLPDGFCNREKASEELLTGWMAPYATDEGKLSLSRNAAALNTNHTMEPSCVVGCGASSFPRTPCASGSGCGVRSPVGGCARRSRFSSDAMVSGHTGRARLCYPVEAGAARER